MDFEQYIAEAIKNKAKHEDSFVEDNNTKHKVFFVEDSDKGNDKKEERGVCMTHSLFMRILELVREDVDDDEALHHLAEKIFELSDDKEDEPLSMDDYDDIEKSVGESDDENEEDDDSSEDQEDEDLDENSSKAK